MDKRLNVNFRTLVIVRCGRLNAFGFFGLIFRLKALKGTLCFVRNLVILIFLTINIARLRAFFFVNTI